MTTSRDLFRKQFAVASDVIVHDVYGVSWDKGESPILTSTDKAVGLVANAGTDANLKQENTFTQNQRLFYSLKRW